jgi:hypothetical protein
MPAMTSVLPGGGTVELAAHAIEITKTYGGEWPWSPPWTGCRSRSAAAGSAS